MSKYKKLSVILLSAFCIPPILLYSQVDNIWVRRYNGPENSEDVAKSIIVDNAGNVYVTGYSFYSNTGYDYLTIKYNSMGQIQWSQRYNGPASSYDRAWAIALDNAGNVYVTGHSEGAGTNWDYATIKCNSAGQVQWVKRYNGPDNYFDVASAIAVDGQGNVYVTGTSWQYGTSYDYVTIKYNSNGVQQWVQRYNGTGNGDDAAYAIAVDNFGNVYVTGEAYYPNSDFDYATIKYDSLGNLQWLRTYNGSGNYFDGATAIAIDSYNNIYVTGSGFGSGTERDYATIKYNSAGTLHWVQRYNGVGNSYDYANAIAIDNAGNVYVTGRSASSNSYPLNYDYATIKYNPNGIEQWAKRYNGLGNSNDQAYAIAVDNQDNIYVTGSSNSNTSSDYTTIKYNSAGQEQWCLRYNGIGNSDDVAFAIALDTSHNIYITGYSYATSVGNPDYVTIKYGATSTIEESKIMVDAKYSTLKIYPNPAKSVIRVCCPSSVECVRIYDVTGKLIKVQEFKGSKDTKVSLDGI
ncbi:MAG: SBBP repeat-containing protein, partial [candidate division WOR-3 bacterium]|nr:SBBP repeat-containing protein [candidate division WOR-3 bacterium]